VSIIGYLHSGPRGMPAPWQDTPIIALFGPNINDYSMRVQSSIAEGRRQYAVCRLPTAFCLSPAQSEVRLPGLGSGRIALDQLKEARAIVLKVLRCRVKPENQSKLAIAIDTVVVEEIR